MLYCASPAYACVFAKFKVTQKSAMNSSGWVIRNEPDLHVY